MHLTYFGHSCFSMVFPDGKVFVLDPFDPSVSLPPCEMVCDVAMVSHDHFDHNYTAGLSGRTGHDNFRVIRTTGSWHIGSEQVTTIESYHDKELGHQRGKNLLMKVAGDITAVHLGDLGHTLDEKQRAFLKDVDVLMIPIGGNYTIDTAEAEKIIRDVDPKVAIAMHFRTPLYPIRISTNENFRRDMHAVQMPNELEITRENIDQLPRVIIMDYEKTQEINTDAQ